MSPHYILLHMTDIEEMTETDTLFFTTLSAYLVETFGSFLFSPHCQFFFGKLKKILQQIDLNWSIAMMMSWSLIRPGISSLCFVHWYSILS